MIYRLITSFLASTLLTLGGCASIVSGTSQSLFIDTPGVEGAKCHLADSKAGSWVLEATPGSVTVAKGNGPMNITCKKEGYKSAVATVDEHIAGAVLGNVILGGGIGVFVDAATGAAQKYPDKATVWMEPVEWTSESAHNEWLEKKKAFDIAEAKAKEEQRSASNPPPARHYCHLRGQ